MDHVSDINLIREKTYGDRRHDGDMIAALADGRAYAFGGDGWLITFRQGRDDPGNWRIWVNFDRGKRGAFAKEMIDAAVAWMFCNTAATKLLAHIPPDNGPCLQLAPLIFAIEDGGRDHRHRTWTTSFKQWANAYGLDKLMAEMAPEALAAKRGAK